MSDSTKSEANIQRSAWEAPAFTELKIGTETKSKSDSAPVAEPQPPTAPTTKLGFSIESSFPIAYRTDQ